MDEVHDWKYIDPKRDDPTRKGMLLSNEIEMFRQHHLLIADEFIEKNLRPAAYTLRIGKEYIDSKGKPGKLGDKNPFFVMKPNSIVYVSTYEKLDLPYYIAARFNLRVKWVYKGILLGTGPQVEPGYCGYLSCPLYNLSDKEVVLRAGDPIALMDFVTTTPFKPGKSKEYRRPPKRVLLEEYKAAELKSALYTEAKQRIDDIGKETRAKIEALEKRMEFFLGSGLVIVTILVAALAIITTFGRDLIVPVWPNVSVLFSILALAFAFVAYSRFRHPK